MNDHKVRELNHESFLHALSAGQIHALDRFGHWVEEGQKVLYKPPVDLVFEVMKISPVMDRSMPPGLLTVILTVSFPVVLSGNQPWQNGVVVGASASSSDRATEDRAATSDEPEPAFPLGPGSESWWRRFFGR